jgi:Glutathione S-transferase, N-terminal domain
MLKFYYATISANSQRVWITLLEKQIPFEPIIVNLDGEQFQSEFTAINPLQQVPAIVDNGLRVFESLAILDYLEAKYPVPELMPKELDKLAIARMISIISLTELQPAAITLSKQLVGVEIDPTSVEKARQGYDCRSPLLYWQYIYDSRHCCRYASAVCFDVWDFVRSLSEAKSLDRAIVPAREFSTNGTNSREGSGCITDH